MSRSAFVTGLTVVVSVLYPLLVFVGPAYFSIQTVALGLLGLLSLRLVFSVRSPRGFAISALALVPIAFAALFANEVALRLMPVMLNLGMLMFFGSTLSTTPIIERFARMFDPDLTPAQAAHCRQFTVIWCVFFAINAVVAFGLCWAPVSIWALYTGPLNYGMMGLLFAAEFLMRRYRFGKYSDKFYDRVLSRMIPRRDGNATPD